MIQTLLYYDVRCIDSDRLTDNNYFVDSVELPWWQHNMIHLPLLCLVSMVQGSECQPRLQEAAAGDGV